MAIVPNRNYARQFYPYSPTEIGIRLRTAFLLERDLNVITVGDLVRTPFSQICGIKQLGEVQLREIKQCLANIGEDVPEFYPDLDNVPQLPHDQEAKFGLPDTPQFAIYELPDK